MLIFINGFYFKLLLSMKCGSLLLLSLIFLNGAGCGMQRGRYVVMGTTYRAFSGQVGGIDVIDGVGATPLNTADTDYGDLLYIIIIGPRIGLHGSSIGSNDGIYVSTFDYSWDADTESLSASIQWDRQTDKIVVGKKVFDRQKGNMLVIQFDNNGKSVARQFTGLIPHANFQQVLKRACEQLPNDDLIQSAKLAK
jgi:hypothetical protein